MQFATLEQMEIPDAKSGILEDSRIKVTGYKSSKLYPEDMRFVRIYDPENDAIVEFISNNFEVSAAEIANLYRHRWDIEVYRYLDRLSDHQHELVQDISVRHTAKLFGGNIGVLFYDVTTLYFEADYEDELRRTGFSKEGRHSNPQIILGLLVSLGGYPLAYCIHEGNKYEGHTMLPTINAFVRKYGIDDFVVVADSGLMNNSNIAELESQGYKYIIGAKIKNESAEIKRWILSQPKADRQMAEYGHKPKSRCMNLAGKCYLCRMKTSNAIWLCLPQGLEELFEMVRFERTDASYDVWLDEKKRLSDEDFRNPNIVARGYTDYFTVQDYPMRGRPVYLHMRKNKWWDKETNEIFSYALELPNEKGTRLSAEFVAFLKYEGGDDRTVD